MRSSGERTDARLYIYISIYLYIVTARPSSPQEGARSRSPQLGECNALWGERELPRFMFVCMFYMLLIYVQHFSYTKG